MGRKPKIYQPIEDTPEVHPWLSFPQDAKGAKNLIIGSFPPNKFTSHRERLSPMDMDFFYGSKENAFWEIFIQVKKLNLKLPNDLPKLKDWILNNNWIVTDIVKQTKRRKDTAFDTDMLITEWNISIIKSIFSKNSIANIFFTSQWVKERFDKFVKHHLENVDFENINQTILLSPSRNGLRSAKLAKFTKYKYEHNETAEQYRRRYYSLVLNV